MVRILALDMGDRFKPLLSLSLKPYFQTSMTYTLVRKQEKKRKPEKKKSQSAMEVFSSYYI